MFDLISEIRQTMRSNRLRTVLTGVSVAWGVFMLIILLGVARGVTNSFHENMTAESSSRIMVWRGFTSKPWHGYRDGRFIDFRDSDGREIEADTPGFVSDVMSVASNDTARIFGPTDYIGGGIQAVYPGSFDNDNIETVAGRLFNERDMAEGRRVMVIAARNARLLFGSEEAAVGSTVRCMDLSWTIVGVYDHRWRNQSYVPFATYKSVTGKEDDVYNLQVNLRNVATEADGEAAEQAVRGTLARVHDFDPTDNNAVWTWNTFSTYLKNRKVSEYLTLAVWVIGLLTLLTGIVGVSNIMFVSVRERTHEIGIRRAIGAKPRSILTQVLAESVAVTAMFGYIGVFCAMVILQVIDHFAGDSEGFKNPTVDISIAVQVTVALIVAGALAGLFPALKAIKVKPVEALRDE